MRYSTMNPYVDVAAHARKRPRSDDVEHTPLPPLHAFNNHHQQQQQMPSVFQPSYHAPMRPAILPTLSQVLNPTMQFSVLAPPPARMPFLQQESFTPPQHHYIRPDVTPSHFEQHQPHAPSPPPSEASMDDDDDAEDKTPWPTASEYYALLTDESKKANIPVYDLGVDPRGVPQQPECIYNEPRSCMYFLKCSQLLGRGSFGFPRKKKTTVTTKNSKGDVESVRRCDVSKEYEWRKMSFVTGLPKKKPIVRYITATCYSKTHRSASEKKKVMRMHAVMLANEDGTGECGDYVLVHIRAGGSKRVGVRTNSSTPSSETLTPIASPASDDSSSPSVPSVRSLLSAHNHLSMTGDRPLTPLIYNNYQGREYSASPVVKRPRGDLMPLAASNACPRQMPLWLSPPSVDHQH